MGPNFIIIIFFEFRTCGSSEQCTRLTIFQQNIEMHVQRAFQTHTKITLKLAIRQQLMPSFKLLLWYSELKWNLDTLYLRDGISSLV